MKSNSILSLCAIMLLLPACGSDDDKIEPTPGDLSNSGAEVGITFMN